MPKKSKEYVALIREITEAIDQRDPLGLLAMGAPPDEYEAQARTIATRIKECVTIETSLDNVWTVFSDSFGASAGRKESYRELATDLVDIASRWTHQRP